MLDDNGLCVGWNDGMKRFEEVAAGDTHTAVLGKTAADAPLEQSGEFIATFGDNMTGALGGDSVTMRDKPRVIMQHNPRGLLHTC